jgi:hypothetical protein
VFSSTSSTDQSALQAIPQGFFAHGFAQECDSTRRQHLHTRRLVGKTRNKNCGYGETVGEETLMELNASQTWHMQVGNQATRVSDTIRIKKIFS